MTASIAGATTSAVLGVAPGPIDHLVITPSQSTVQSGQWASFLAEGFDQYGNDLGDVTASTLFGVSPEGRCSNNDCAADVPGRHVVTGWNGSASGSAALDVSPVG